MSKLCGSRIPSSNLNFSVQETSVQKLLSSEVEPLLSVVKLRPSSIGALSIRRFRPDPFGFARISFRSGRSSIRWGRFGLLVITKGMAPTFAVVTRGKLQGKNERRFPPIQLAARKYGSKDGKPSVSFSAAEQQVGIDNLKHSLVAKFSGGRPAIDEVRRSFVEAWSVNGSCSIGALDARHILIVLDSESDARKVLSHPMRNLGLSFFRVFRWTIEFDTKKESTSFSSWVRLSNLPPQLFNQGYIESLVNSFGRFLAVDYMTTTFNNPSFARVCIELDVSKTPPDKVWISTGPQSGFWVKLIYENRIRYCTKCSLHGHQLESCRKALQRREDVGKIWSRDDYVLPKSAGASPQPSQAHSQNTQRKDNTGQSKDSMAPLSIPDLPSSHDMAENQSWTLVQSRNQRRKQVSKAATAQSEKKETSSSESVTALIHVPQQLQHAQATKSIAETKVQDVETKVQTNAVTNVQAFDQEVLTKVQVSAETLEKGELNSTPSKEDVHANVVHSSGESASSASSQINGSESSSKECILPSLAVKVATGFKEEGLGSWRDSSDSDEWSVSDESEEEERSSIQCGKSLKAFQMIKRGEPKKKDAIKSQMRLRKDKLEALKRTYIEALERTKVRSSSKMEDKASVEDIRKLNQSLKCLKFFSGR